VEVAVIKPLRQPLLPDLGCVPRVACVALQRQLLVDAAGVALEVNRVRVNVALCREAAELADAQPASGEDRRVAGGDGGRVSGVGDVVHNATTRCAAGEVLRVCFLPTSFVSTYVVISYGHTTHHDVLKGLEEGVDVHRQVAGQARGQWLQKRSATQHLHRIEDDELPEQREHGCPEPRFRDLRAPRTGD